MPLISAGEEKLVVAYRPFAALQPYAKVGPFFQHAHACTHYSSDQLSAWFAYLEPAIVRGFG